MEQNIYFIKLDTFFSKKQNKNYFTVEYLTNDDKLTYYKEFISQKDYEKLYEKDLELFGEYTAILSIDSNRHIKLVDIN